MKETYRCWAEIDRSALRHNAKVVRERIGPAQMLAVVKADGYGHGIVGVAQALADDAQLFGVANLEEASDHDSWSRVAGRKIDNRSSRFHPFYFHF